jgi:arylsulfatase A-like enzyme
VTHVPFIILPPFLLEPGIRVSQTVSNADVWPTILDIVGLPPLPNADGRSLLPQIHEAGGGAAANEPERPIFAEIARRWGNPKVPPEYLVSVTQDGKRLIMELDEPGKIELFDRVADPLEKTNLAQTHPEETAKLRELIDGYVAKSDSPWGVEPAEVELDEMRLNQLRALGYVIKP